tara:strand:- start:187 stop:837 length:651 start_codon:yes stop_codon:yes gene_type:complete
MTNGCPTSSNPFTDDTFANDLIIQTVASGKYLIFRDGIDSFDRSYSISWDQVSVYGRQDAIQTYMSTGETISLSFPLKPSTIPDEFNRQLEAILALGKFARPYYSGGLIKESPILKIRYRNLIVEEYNDSKGTPLWIAPTSISVNYGDRARDVLAAGSQTRKLIVPKRISISLSAAVINVDKKYYDDDPTPIDLGEDTIIVSTQKEAAVANINGAK